MKTNKTWILGPRFRSKRVGLGIRGDELGLPAEVVARLPWIEDGTESPPDWHELGALLRAALEARVRGHLERGGDWRDLLLAGWSAAEIRTAVRNVRADLALARVSASG